MADNSTIIKGYDLTKQLYAEHARILEKRAQDFLDSLSAEAKKPIEELLELTDESKQNEELEQAIEYIESEIGNPESNIWNAENAQGAVAIWANKILELDKNIGALGQDPVGLRRLAEGNYKEAFASASNNQPVNLVSNDGLNQWLIKTVKKIEKIYNEHKKGASIKTPLGTLSNLKGAYLEAAVTERLQSENIKDVESSGEDIDGGTFDVINSGNVRTGNRQMAEDIVLVFGDGSKKNLQELFSSPSQGKYYSIDVPAYQQLQEESVGITVKAGSAPIKFYEGNLNSFFLIEDIDVQAYHRNVLLRPKTKHQDNVAGRSVNYWIVANDLYKAMGSNNIFLSTRNNILMKTSDYIEHLGESEANFLYMTAYKISGDSISGRVMGRK